MIIRTTEVRAKIVRAIAYGGEDCLHCTEL